MAISAITGKEISDDNPFATSASGTGFVSPFEPEMLSPESRQEQYVAEQMQKNVERVDSENPDWSWNDTEQVARAFIDGLWLNKADEVGSYLAATAFKLLNPEMAKDLSVKDIAADMKINLEAEAAQFGERRPITQAVTNITGSVLSPVSLAGGRLIGQAAQLRRGQQAVQGAPAVLGRSASSTDELAQMGMMYGAQQSGRTAAALARVPTPVAAAGVAAAEGAVIGAEGETFEDKAKNAAFTAGISATVPFAFAGAKKTFDFATESKMGQQIGKGADFVNLMFTEHGLSQVYRSVISKAYGARTLTEQQARSLVARIPTPKAAREAATLTKDAAKRKLMRAKQVISQGKDEALATARNDIDAEISKVKTEIANSTGDAKARYQQRLFELEEVKGDANLAKAETIRQADEAVNSANGAFRGQVMNSAVPSGASADEIAALGSLDPQDANVLLDDLWRKYGFTFANGKQYSIVADNVANFVDKVAKDYPELALVEGGSMVGRIKQYIGTVLDEVAPDGNIRGEDLVQLRSTIGRAINALSDDKVSTRRFSAEVQDYFHDLIGTKLSKAERAAFEADKTAWSVRSLVDDAINKASGGDARGGAFTPQDLLNSIRSYSPRFAARGAGRFQKEAQELANMTAQNKQNIIDLADRNLRDIAQEALKEKTALRASLEQSKAALRKKQEAEIASLNNRYKGIKLNQEAKADRAARLAEMKALHKQQIADLDGEVEKVASDVSALSELMPGNFKSSVFENLFNTAIVGQVLSPPGIGESIKSTLATGLVGSRVLATETAQRILARQTTQQAAARAGVKRAGEAIGRVVPEGVGQVGSAVAGAAMTAESLSPTRPLFSEERKKILRDLPISGKAALYRNLEAKGQLDRLAAEDPQLFKEIRNAARK